MNRPTTTARLVLLRACAVLVSVAFAATLATAADRSATATTAPADTSAIEASPMPADSCLDVEEAALFTPLSETEISSSVDLDLDMPGVTPMTPAGKSRRGFCRCTCSSTPNCTTNADCGGGLCLKGPTCC